MKNMWAVRRETHHCRYISVTLTVSYLPFLASHSILKLVQEVTNAKSHNRGRVSFALGFLAGRRRRIRNGFPRPRTFSRSPSQGHGYRAFHDCHYKRSAGSDHQRPRCRRNDLGGRFYSQRGRAHQPANSPGQPGRFTLTAGNGDHLTGTYKGTAHMVGIPNVIEYDVAGLISGGTGQFEGMSGAIVFHGSADLGQGTFKDEILGVVTHDR